MKSQKLTAAKGRSLWDDAWDSLRRNRAAMAAMTIMGAVIVLVLLGGLVFHYLEHNTYNDLSVHP